MPVHPKTAAAPGAIRASVYSAFEKSLASREGEVYPLHVGDTWLSPPEGCRVEDVHESEYKGLNQYSHVAGIPALRDTIVERASARLGMPVERSEVIVTAGATSGLANVIGAVADPGDEVLILAPYWPLIAGIVRFFSAVPVAVPFHGVADSAEAAVMLIQGYRTSKTVALYVNTPNNPTGSVVPRDWMEAIAAWAEREGLWVLSDEVYEDLVYEGEHVYARPLAPERTIAAHSFSKAFGMAGYRCGYLVGPAPVITEALKVGTHTIYSTPTPSQIAALRTFGGPGDAFLAKARASYSEVKERAAARLGIPAPKGSTFLFFDIAPHLDATGLAGFLEKCAAKGLLVAPGPSFGPYPTHIRVCFTCAPPDLVLRGVEVLARLLGR